MTECTRRIVDQLRAVPEGKVCSYGGVARKADLPGGARQVVRVLHSLSEKQGLPWHRIVRRDGSIALVEGEGRELQAALLRTEGVEVSASGKVDMARFGV